MRSLVGLLNITSGRAQILDQEVSVAASGLRAKIGYLPGPPALYKNLTGLEHLKFLSKMRGIDCTQQKVAVMQTRGAAILLSSHALGEVEHLADRVVIVNAGKQILVEEISSLKEKTVRTIDLYFGAPVEEEIFAGISRVQP